MGRYDLIVLGDVDVGLKGLDVQRGAFLKRSQNVLVAFAGAHTVGNDLRLRSQNIHADHKKSQKEKLFHLILGVSDLRRQHGKPLTVH